MHAHKLRSIWFILLLSGLFIVVAGCNRPRKVETAAEGQEKQKPVQRQGEPDSRSTDSGSKATGTAEPASDIERNRIDAGLAETTTDLSSSGAKEAATAELARQLKRLKFKARREVVAARTTIENIPSYARSLEKFEREFEQWGMYTEVPREPGYDELKKEISRAVGKVGLELLYYNVLESDEKTRKLPEVIHGNKSFSFEDNDVREAFQVTVRIPKVPREKQAELLSRLKALDRLLLVRRFKSLSDSILINMDAYWFAEERYPLHQVLARDLKIEMEQLGITGSMEEVMQKDSVGYLQNAALSYKELNSSLPKINEAMALLSRSKFLEARSAFFRKTVEAAAAASPLR